MMAAATPTERATVERITTDQSYRAAMKSLIAARWAEVWRAMPAALAGEGVDGVHDVRVASRRLRAAMDVAVDCFPAAWYRPLHRAAKEITSALGEIRDRDVLLVAFTDELARAPAAEQPGIVRLIDRVERERAAARSEMESFLRDFISGDVPNQVVARFGEASGPPAGLWQAVDRDRRTAG